MRQNQQITLMGHWRVRWIWHGLWNGPMKWPRWGRDWSISGVCMGREGRVWITWYFGWKITMSKGSLKRCCPSSSFLRGRTWGLYCRKWRRGEVRRKSPWLWLKYGNWWSKILEPLSFALEVRVFQFSFRAYLIFWSNCITTLNLYFLTYKVGIMFFPEGC